MDAFLLSMGLVVVVIMLGIIGYFLNRAINNHNLLKANSVSKSELARAEKDACEATAAVRNEHKEKLEKLSRDIERIKEDYITKDDFFRKQAETDRKLDMILELLLKQKGAGNGG